MSLHIFHLNYGRVYYHTNRNCKTAKRHQICAYSLKLHHDKCSKQRKWQCYENDKASPEAVQQKIQHDQNKKRAFNQSLVYRADACIHNIASIVIRSDLDAFRKDIVFID